MPHTSSTSLKRVALAYAKLLKLNVTASDIQRSVEENPSYPSLLSLSDTFSKYGVDNNAYHVPADAFDQLEPPFVAYTQIRGIGNDFVLITKIKEDSIHYIYKNNTAETISREEFLQRYQKIVWFAEANAKSGDPDFKKTTKEEKLKKAKRLARVAGIASLAAIIIAGSITTGNFLAYSTILVIKAAGIAATVLLLVYEIDKDNAFVKNICSSTGSRTNCDIVLDSKASRIFGISWSEIGFFYFVATFLLLAMPGVAFSDKTMWLAVASATAAPYILFSIYFQWRIIKHWCPLCTAVQILLVIEQAWAVILFWSSSFRLQFPIHDLPILTVCIFLPMLLWYSMRPLFTKAKDHDLFVAAYRRLQFNPAVFIGLLQQQPKAADNWQQLGINIGNPDATTTIIKVCNPYCGPCSSAHQQLEEMVKSNNQIQLKIIFKTSNENNDRGAIIAKHLLAISSGADATKTQQALEDWYMADKKDYEQFLTKYPNVDELGQQDAKIEAMSKWCVQSDITFTPTIFIDGYRIPENYDLKELKQVLLYYTK